MLKMRQAFRVRRVAALPLFQFAAIFGLSVAEASHNHDDPDSEHHSAHAQCVLCGHVGMGMPVAQGAGFAIAPPVHDVRAHSRPSSRVVAVDAGFSTQPRAPPVA